MGLTLYGINCWKGHKKLNFDIWLDCMKMFKDLSLLGLQEIHLERKMYDQKLLNVSDKIWAYYITTRSYIFNIFKILIWNHAIDILYTILCCHFNVIFLWWIILYLYTYMCKLAKTRNKSWVCLVTLSRSRWKKKIHYLARIIFR